MSEIFELISVRPPYCALEDPVLGDGTVTARVRRTYPMKQECGPIAAAEVGRHLAIAGAVAAATRNAKTGKHFYLARGARIERVADGVAGADNASGFQIGASSDGVEQRRAIASAVLRQEQSGRWVDLYRIEVEYDVISPAIYARMARGLPEIDMSVLREEDVFSLPLTPVLDQYGAARAELTVKPEFCFGHFPEYPSFPVAKMMHLLSNLAGEHLALRSGVPGLRYAVERAGVSAERLPFAGSVVTLRSAHVGEEPDGTHHFKCAALIGDDLCGAMDLYLSVQS